VSGLRLAGLAKRYGDVAALEPLDLAVADGELLVVLGPSGCGKTTLLRLIAGLEEPTAGTVEIGGRLVTEWRPGSRNVAMVFQSYALFPHLTVAENIAFGLVVRDVRRAAASERVAVAARLVGCEELLARRPYELSGGERQRVALARALVREPDVFLFDEPLSNLDASMRVAMRTELHEIHRRVGGTTLHVTHDQVEAMVLGDRIAVLRAGRLQQIGTPDEIWRTPANRFVATFVGAPRMNVLPADGPLSVPGVVAGQEIGVRPEHVRLGPDGISAAVVLVETVGSDAYLHLDLAGTRIVARVDADRRHAVGDTVRVAVRPADAHRFDAVTGERMTAS
jgi:multiple sugar transport system ATP-binding protein